MITTLALFPEDKPLIRVGVDLADGLGRALLEVCSGLSVRVALHSVSRFELVCLHHELSQFLEAHQPTDNDFADEEARRQEQAAGSYAGCDSNHNQQ